MFEKSPNLAYTTVFPRRVTSARMAQTALSLVGGDGESVLLGGFGGASVLLDFDREIVGCLTVKISCDAPAHIRINYDEEAELADPDDYIRQKHGKDFDKFQKEIRPDGQIVYTLRETVCYIYEFNEI